MKKCKQVKCLFYWDELTTGNKHTVYAKQTEACVFILTPQTTCRVEHLFKVFHDLLTEALSQYDLWRYFLLWIF